MNDRELLELAAKAAGRSIRWEGIVAVLQDYEPGVDDCSAWYPLEDDGDALRLAVRLGLGFGIDKDARLTTALTPPYFSEHHGKDPYAATRRAIVRAAAAIGEAK